MKLEDMSKEELETLSFADLAHLILKENKKAMNTPSIFKKICELLEYSDEDYSAKIGDFYTSLTTDKRFILLDSGDWDLRDNHSVKIVMDDDEDEEIIDEEETDEDEDEEVEEDIDTPLDDDLGDDDMVDLAVIDEEELEEEN